MIKNLRVKKIVWMLKIWKLVMSQLRKKYYGATKFFRFFQIVCDQYITSHEPSFVFEICELLDKDDKKTSSLHTIILVDDRKLGVQTFKEFERIWSATKSEQEKEDLIVCDKF